MTRMQVSRHKYHINFEIIFIVHLFYGHLLLKLSTRSRPRLLVKVVTTKVDWKAPTLVVATLTLADKCSIPSLLLVFLPLQTIKEYINYRIVMLSLRLSIGFEEAGKASS